MQFFLLINGYILLLAENRRIQHDNNPAISAFIFNGNRRCIICDSFQKLQFIAF